MKKKQLVITAAILLSLFFTVVAFVGYPIVIDFSNDVGMSSSMQYEEGNTITPFSSFDFNNGEWVAYILIHNDDNNSQFKGVLKTTDKRLLAKINTNCKFIYTGGDIATIQSELLLYRNNELVFKSGIVIDSTIQGLQNKQYGWLEASPTNSLTEICREFQRIYSPIVLLR